MMKSLWRVIAEKQQLTGSEWPNRLSDIMVEIAEQMPRVVRDRRYNMPVWVKADPQDIKAWLLDQADKAKERI